MKRIERAFLLFLTAAMIAVMLPISAMAAVEIVDEDDDFIVEFKGNDNNIEPGRYKIEIVNSITNSSSYCLRISLNGNYEYTSEILNNGKLYEDWVKHNIRISLKDGIDRWDQADTGYFTVTNKSQNITAAANVRLVDFTNQKIESGDRIKPTFEVVDLEVNDNGSFVDTSSVALVSLDSESFFQTDDETIRYQSNTSSKKVTFHITIPVRYTGEGNSISFSVFYRTIDGIGHTLMCTATIPNTIDKRDEYLYDDEEDDIPDDTPIPYIIVDSYDYGASSVTAGEDFELTLRLRNTSSDHSLENIVMSVSPMGVFSMASSSNTFYINRLMAGSIIEKKISINTGLTKVTDDEDANSINIKFTYQYGIRENDVLKLKSGDSSESITLPVNFPDRFELGVPEYNSRVFAGEEMYLTVPMVNKGRSSIYNISASVKGDMSNPGQMQYIGNLNAGTESSADFSIIFDEPGTHSGEVVVTYEDTNMNPKEVSTTFSITVQKMDVGIHEPEMPIMPEEPAEPVDVQPKQDKTKPIKIVLALLVGSMSAYTTIARAKAKRSIYLDEDI